MIEREASINDNSGINMLEILFSNLHKPNCLESLASSNFFSLVSQLLQLNFLLFIKYIHRYISPETCIIVTIFTKHR